MIDTSEIIRKVKQYLSEVDDATLRKDMIDAGYDFYKKDIFIPYHVEELMYSPDTYWRLHSSLGEYSSSTLSNISYDNTCLDTRTGGDEQLKMAA